MCAGNDRCLPAHAVGAVARAPGRDHVLSLGEPDDRDTWTELTEGADGALVLSVVLLAGQARLSREQAGVMAGELAEAWMTAAYARAGG